MKLARAMPPAAARRTVERAFTLPEILIASTISLVLLGGIVAANLFGLRIFQLSQTKLNATQWSRETLMRLTDEIHACSQAQVGVVSNGIFSAFLDGETQQGNALLVNPTSDTNNYVIYFVDTDDQTFRRTTQQTNSTVILASSVANPMAFAAEDYSGNVLTNNINNQLIHFTLEICQPGSFMQRADYCKLDTEVKQRVGP